MSLARSLGITFVWAIPFLVSGIAAPFLFSNIENRQTAGHYAGVLFIFSGIWFVLLAFRHHYPAAVCGLAILFFLLSLLFWSWRFQTATPLNQTRFLGLPGDMWHQGLTGIYFICLCALAYFEWRRAK